MKMVLMKEEAYNHRALKTGGMPYILYWFTWRRTRGGRRWRMEREHGLETLLELCRKERVKQGRYAEQVWIG